MYCPKLLRFTLQLLPQACGFRCFVCTYLVGSLRKALFKELRLCLKTEHDEKRLMKIPDGRLKSWFEIYVHA